MKNTGSQLLAAALLFSFGLGNNAQAVEPAASPWAAEEQVSVRLISAATSTGDGKALRLGVQFTLQPGWKVYWRSPGDAGFPPQPTWTGARNANVAALDWPAPHRFSVLGLETLGYKDEVVFPFSVTVPDPTQPAVIGGTVRYLTCDDICIPYEAKLALSLPPGPTRPSAFAHLINTYDAIVPGDGRGHGLELTALAAAGTTKQPTVRLAARGRMPFVAPDVFFEGPPSLGFGKPTITLSEDGHEVVLEARVIGLEYMEPAPTNGVIGLDLKATLVDGRRSAEAEFKVVAASEMPAPSDTPDAAPGILLILGLAVLGGLILNLMPCVLPVLSIKLLSVVKHGGGERRVVRASFIASAAGIISAFMVLAGALIALKASGMAFGWGIQFQQPWFLALMAVLVSVFAANLMGWFEFRLPGAVADVGERAGHVRGLGGHFLQGAFATLLATPCSAPFLGTAVGFALARGALEIAMVFSALGLGLALPYLAIAAIPRLATMMPRPGAWMIIVRRVLGVALWATAAWLVSVLVGVAGGSAAIAVMVGLVSLTVLLWMRSRSTSPGLAVGAIMVAIAVIASPALLSEARSTVAASTTAWQPFDRALIADHVRAGKTVFVDVTADWCITCQVNKRLVLDTNAVQRVLDGKDVVLMRGDWTRPDPAIAEYLASFGRYGIPFNAVYGPHAPDGIPLPELLSQHAVLDALATARRQAVAAN